MAIIDRLIMLSLAVTDMPKAKAFYTDSLGLTISKDYRQDENNWWVSLALPDNSATLTLTTNHENMKPGTLKLYFATTSVTDSHKTLLDKGLKVNDIKDDLYGPGSGVKWFSLDDPDGNQVFLVQV